MNNYSSARARTDNRYQPLSLNLEVLANLIYLANLAETHSDRQRHYLDWAADVIRDMRNHPRLYE
jgi:hypothetical protein